MVLSLAQVSIHQRHEAVREMLNGEQCLRPQPHTPWLVSSIYNHSHTPHHWWAVSTITATHPMPGEQYLRPQPLEPHTPWLVSSIYDQNHTPWLVSSIYDHSHTHYYWWAVSTTTATHTITGEQYLQPQPHTPLLVSNIYNRSQTHHACWAVSTTADPGASHTMTYHDIYNDAVGSWNPFADCNLGHK